MYFGTNHGYARTQSSGNWLMNEMRIIGWWMRCAAQIQHFSLPEREREGVRVKQRSLKLPWNMWCATPVAYSSSLHVWVCCQVGSCLREEDAVSKVYLPNCSQDKVISLGQYLCVVCVRGVCVCVCMCMRVRGVCMCACVCMCVWCFYACEKLLTNHS